MTQHVRFIAVIILGILSALIVTLASVADLPEAFEQLAGVAVGAIAGLVVPRSA